MQLDFMSPQFGSTSHILSQFGPPRFKVTEPVAPTTHAAVSQHDMPSLRGWAFIAASVVAIGLYGFYKWRQHRNNKPSHPPLQPYTGNRLS